MNNIIQYLQETCIKRFEEIQEELFKDPTQFAEFVIDIDAEVKKLGIMVVQETLETMDAEIQKSLKRRLHWEVESHDKKQLMTSLGTVHFKKTLYRFKDGKDENGKEIMCYLLDKTLGLTPNQRMTDDATAKIYGEAVQTSYRRGGEAVNNDDSVSKEAVKDLLHKTKFPPNFQIPEQKKKVDYLYIDADEDHFSLQFKEKKGDLEKNEKGRKLNGAITKLIYVYEGIEPDAPKSKRNHLVNPHYFCRVADENAALWDEVYAYIDATYDIPSIKKIYLNSDGGAWIKAGFKRLEGIQYVLDEFHLSKYILKMTAHMLDSQADARIEVCKTIREKEKKDFKELVERLKGYTEKESELKRITESAEYIESNWAAAKRRLWKKDGLAACSAEGHVSHVLSSRMSTLPLGWSKHGAHQMAHLREYYYNRGDMLELAKYQREELPEAVGAEKDILSSTAIIRSEIAERSKEQREYGKYHDAMTHTWSAQTRTKYNLYVSHWF